MFGFTEWNYLEVRISNKHEEPETSRKNEFEVWRLFLLDWIQATTWGNFISENRINKYIWKIKNQIKRSSQLLLVPPASPTPSLTPNSNNSSRTWRGRCLWDMHLLLSRWLIRTKWRNLSLQVKINTLMHLLRYLMWTYTGWRREVGRKRGSWVSLSIINNMARSLKRKKNSKSYLRIILLIFLPLWLQFQNLSKKR